MENKECLKDFCKQKIYNKSDHRKRLLQIKQRYPLGDYETKDDYKQLIYCFNNNQPFYLSEEQCNSGYFEEHKKKSPQKTQRKKCPNGTRKNKEGICVEKKTKQPKQPKQTKQTKKNYTNQKKRAKCPNGSRKNKQGVCVEYRKK